MAGLRSARLNTFLLDPTPGQSSRCAPHFIFASLLSLLSSATGHGHVTAFVTKVVINQLNATPSDPMAAPVLSMGVACTASEWQLSSLEQACTSFLPPISMLEDLYILENPYRRPRWQDDVENTLWLELLHPFAAVKNLYLSEEFAPRIVPALQELVGGRTIEVLPILENIFLKGLQPSGPLQKGIEKFVAARQLTSHPVAVSHWDWDSKQKTHQEVF